MILHAKRRRATVAINRLGEVCVLSEPAGDAGHDGYGKSTADEQFVSFGVERVVKVYGSGATNPVSERHLGGRLPADSPLLVLTHDTAVQAGFRVVYAGETFEIDSMTTYPTHVEANTTLVTGSA
ncbi:hypothetical protein [Halonotius roseus]|uniref:Uncharacterized protein n=1 Tax=Halonotius roseus TaxID=2511997 RepID=A0A544QQY7_9EURY|nr:hypothetical protein [Halonotius roseus]TQQ81855.1 hypothetical protein EWF95_02655 [Halonotius roseus]